ncbi:Zn(II)2Cys6 transcription factor [Aspergillus ibericus CBS 121593]|uniref:C6 finger domain protein n=1 Tax=Aspergillus ibericus CBS 121593 TaxID=1448316 RepID=A0A395GU97_9EURO|nr:C6 finger domain protein [Aspergillus ibericus CBS 121593]RAK99141.1 C6 finger domain protein [Aspergillus ibericus CBS 121593]
MAPPYPSSQAPLTSYPPSFLSLQDQNPPLSAYSILGTGQYPESVAFWHNPPAQPQPPLPPAAIAASYPSGPPKPQSLLQPASDQKKHKRTRSGCFTCRSRRIKCDEARPICDRCRKGNRDCVYPSATAGASKSGARAVSKPRGSLLRGTESSSQAGSEELRVLEPIADEEEDGTSVGSSAHLSPSTAPTPTTWPKPSPPKRQTGQSLRQPGGKPFVATEPGNSRIEASTSPSPSTDTSSRFDSLSARSASVGASLPDPAGFGLPSITHLADDLRFYLTYHQEFITYRHYFLKPANDRFVHQSIIELALQYDPLLYAVVGFSAYHRCVQTDSGKLYTFLKYYNIALTLLRKSLGSGEPHSEAMLITVLVLTTFEESIGDWVNLIGHHQAAHALVREILTPESASLNELHSNIFTWYARFDVVAGILAGNETILGREWYIAKEEYDAQQAALHPGDVEKQLALANSINRRFGLEMASLYAKLSRGLIPINEFMVHNEVLGQTLERVRGILETFHNSEYTVRDYPYRVPLTPEDIVDPYIPGGLHHGPLWEVNMTWIDYYSTKAMYKYQTLLSVKQSSVEELGALSMELARLMEAVDRWPVKENGYILSFKNSIGMAAMFCPRDERYIMWARRKFAQLEQSGYVVAAAFRTALAALWQKPEINGWWLPDEEGYPSIIREVRAMTEERTSHPRDNFREDVSHMKTLFWNITLDDTESESSPTSVGTDIR